VAHAGTAARAPAIVEGPSAPEAHARTVRRQISAPRSYHIILGGRMRMWCSAVAPDATGRGSRGQLLGAGRKIWPGGFGVDKSQAKRFCYQDFGWRA